MKTTKHHLKDALPSWEIIPSKEGNILLCKGKWRALTLHSVRMPGDCKKITLTRVDVSQVTGLDTAGAWMIHALAEHLMGKDSKGLAWKGSASKVGALIEPFLDTKKKPAKEHSLCRVFCEELGKATISIFQKIPELLTFLGMLMVYSGRVIMSPKALRWRAVAQQIELTGVGAVPIIILISFLIGVVLAYQGAFQLRRFGAEVFTVDLLAISVLREISVLLTAIVVAGRSGSAFTAQLGSMRLNQEVDALSTFGLDPIQVLVLPRVLALVIVLPLLTFLSNMVALLGGGIMCLMELDIPSIHFIRQLQHSLTAWTFWLGVLKAPFFAFVISMVGCFEGLRVKGGAENLGRQTTLSVVEGIFLVIVCDAMFSIFFTKIGV